MLGKIVDSMLFFAVCYFGECLVIETQKNKRRIKRLESDKNCLREDLRRLKLKMQKRFQHNENYMKAVLTALRKPDNLMDP